MAIPSVPTDTTPAAFKAWAEAVTALLNTLEPPTGTEPVFVTTDESVVTANPTKYIILAETP